MVGFCAASSSFVRDVQMGFLYEFRKEWLSAVKCYEASFYALKEVSR